MRPEPGGRLTTAVLAADAPHMRDEAGFTLIEILVAMTILLVGILGTVAMIDGAKAATSTVKGREGATNLARELIEASRAVDYDRLGDAWIAGELRQRPELADSDATPGWQITRRGMPYTVTVTACTFDDQTDGAGAHDATFCPGSATTPAGDPNPDDYRRATFVVRYRDHQAAREVSQTAILGNPAGGLGPTITSFTGTPASIGPSTTSVSFTARSSAAASLTYSVDDGGVGGQAGGGPTTWTFPWQLGSVGAFSCGQRPAWVLDGSYLLTAQAFDGRGVPGDLKSYAAQVDRSAPAPPCGLDGGRNGSIVDLEWRANDERDIAGYRAFRVRTGSEDADPQVCALATATACYDPSPPSAEGPSPRYYVRAYDASGGTASEPRTIAVTSNEPPASPASLTARLVDGQPTLEWPAASDPDGTIRAYRIYKGGTEPSDRYDVASDVQRSYIDRRAGGAGDRYWIRAVDDEFRESAAVGPVTP